MIRAIWAVAVCVVVLVAYPWLAMIPAVILLVAILRYRWCRYQASDWGAARADAWADLHAIEDASGVPRTPRREKSPRREPGGNVETWKRSLS